MYPCESFAKKGPQPLTFCAVCGVLASGKQCASRVPPPGCDPEGKDTKITQGNGERNGRETGRQGTRQQTSGERTLEPQHAEKSARRRRHSWPDCWPAQNRPAVAIMEPESAPPLKAIVHAGTFGDSWRSCTARHPEVFQEQHPAPPQVDPAHTLEATGAIPIWTRMKRRHGARPSPRTLPAATQNSDWSCIVRWWLLGIDRKLISVSLRMTRRWTPGF